MLAYTIANDLNREGPRCGLKLSLKDSFTQGAILSDLVRNGASNDYLFEGDALDDNSIHLHIDGNASDDGHSAKLRIVLSGAFNLYSQEKTSVEYNYDLINAQNAQQLRDKCRDYALWIVAGYTSNGVIRPEQKDAKIVDFTKLKR